MKLRSWVRGHRWILLILLVGFGFRIFGLNWDDGRHFHPDERMIAIVADRLEWVAPWEAPFWQVAQSDGPGLVLDDSPMHPDFFAYGSMPMYLLALTGWLSSLVFDNPELARYGEINLVGRFLSALFDTGTILLVYLIGRRLGGKKLGYWSSWFYALSVLPIQLSHFFAVDTVLTFFVTLGLFLLVRVDRFVRWTSFVWVGIVWGLAMATKATGVLLALPIGVAGLWQIVESGQAFDSEDYAPSNLAGRQAGKQKRLKLSLNELARWIGWGLLMGLTALVVWGVTQPYAVLDWQQYIDETQHQSKMSRDAWMFPFTRQYMHTTPYVYHLEQVARWGMGWALGLMSLVGLLCSGVWLVRYWKEKMIWGLINWRGLLIVTVFGVSYWLMFGGFEVKFMRYMLPIYPVMALWAGLGLAGIGRFVNRYLKGFPVVTVVGSLVTILSLVWVLSFLNIYRYPNTRIMASLWMHTNLPADYVLGIEHWDDALPIPPWNTFEQVTLPLYEYDTQRKWREMALILEDVDVIVLASNRLSRPLARLIEEYPISSQYYDLLLNEELGFEIAAEFERPPGLGNWRVDDQMADESFYVYDHPKIVVLVKTDDWSAQDYFDTIRSGREFVK